MGWRLDVTAVLTVQLWSIRAKQRLGQLFDVPRRVLHNLHRFHELQTVCCWPVQPWRLDDVCELWRGQLFRRECEQLHVMPWRVVQHRGRLVVVLPVCHRPVQLRGHHAVCKLSWRLVHGADVTGIVHDMQRGAVFSRRQRRLCQLS